MTATLSMRPLAATLVTLTLLRAPVALGQENASAPALTLEARAQTLYQQGREHFHAGRFEDARAAFQASLDTVDSPNARMYLGRSLARLGRVAEAWAMLDRAAQDAAARARQEPRYQATGESARTEADALRPGLGWIIVRIEPMPDDLAVRVGDHAVLRGGLGVEIPFAPGEVAVTARAAGYRAAEARATLAAGETVEVRLALDPDAPPTQDASVAVAPRGATTGTDPVAPVVYSRRGPVRTAGLVVGLTGLATLAAGAVFGALALDQYTSASSGSLQDDLITEGIRNRDTANALFIAGGALTAAGLLMWLVAPMRAERGAAPRPSLTLSPAGVGLRGSF